jgi:hypothetical protein
MIAASASHTSPTTGRVPASPRAAPSVATTGAAWVAARPACKAPWSARASRHICGLLEMTSLPTSSPTLIARTSAPPATGVDPSVAGPIASFDPPPSSGNMPAAAKPGPPSSRLTCSRICTPPTVSAPVFVVVDGP